MSLMPSNSHLPNELLLNVFHYLDHDNLYQLTLVSDSFSRLALLVYFARRKVSISPDGQADFPNPLKTMEMLPFIRKASFITSISRLSCGLLQPHHLFLEDIAHLVTILKNVNHVEEFGINFFVSSDPWTPAMVKQANAQNRLYNALHELFTTAARVSCTMMIRNGTSLRNVLQKAEKNGSGGPKRLGWSLAPAITRLFSPDKSSKHQKAPVYQRPEAVGNTLSAFHPDTIKGSRLRALEVNSIILLSPPFLDWTIRTLNANEITQLAFGTIEYQDVNWVSLLSQLHLPSLTHLTFRGYTPLGALVDFMARHTNVTNLTIDNLSMDDVRNNARSVMIADADRAAQIAKAFTNIKRLSSCPQGLLTLFSNRHDGDTTIFPNLQAVSVLWGIGLGQQLKMSIIGDMLAPIAHKLASKKLVFVIAYGADASSAWRSPVPFRGGPLVNNNDITTTSTPPSIFPYFTEIRLEISPKVDRGGIPQLMERLAESLGNIRRFKVDSRSRFGRYPERVPKAFLVHQISKRFRNLRMVSIDGVKLGVAQRF